MSLLEDWEDDRQPNSPFATENPDDILEGYVNLSVKKEEELPIFSLEKVEYKPNGLKHMVLLEDEEKLIIAQVVSSNILVMALNNGHIIRLNLKTPEELEDIEIGRRPEDQIHKLFLDPTGSHLIISMETEDNYYLHLKWKKPKIMSKMKGVIVESVAWDKQNLDPLTTREILIGTTKGRIFETLIEANERAFMERLVGGKEQIFKPVYNVGDNMPISGLAYERFPDKDVKKYFIMATTATRLYQFIGGPTFEVIFPNYDTNPGFHELRGDFRIEHSELQFFSPHPQALPKSFAWLTGPGVYHGDLVFGSQQLPGDSVVTDTKLLYYPTPSTSSAELPKPAISLVLTEFHFLLLYPDKIQAISYLNNEIVWEEYFPKTLRLGTLQGLAFDSIAKTIWLYAASCVYEIVVTKEDRHVWELYLEKGQFESALSYCKNAAQKDKVWTAQADHYFNAKNYKLAAPYYGKTLKSFEEVTLKFINIGEHDALKTYLLHKLESINSHKVKDETQLTLITTWLTEIYLDRLNQLKDNNNSSNSNSNSSEAHDTLKEEFEAFLKDNKEHLSRAKATTFNLISSHGRIDELLYFATVIEDYERVISLYIQQADYLNALKVLSSQHSEEQYYKFSPLLMNKMPYHTVNAWIRASSALDPRKLIPSLMRYNPNNNPPNEKHVNQAIRFLVHCVRTLENKDPAIHNYLLSLYAQEKDDSQLLKFLSQPETYFDLKYALRLCTQEGKTKACVLIYSAMGLFEEAVDLALKVDMDLAKINADKPEDDAALRKKLWLKIARYLVEQQKDIKKAMELLTQCELLKIEDILPFFPDFTRIDDFKEEICSSLEDYNRHIEELKIEMEEATRSADLIRMDIKQLRNKYGQVGASRQCDLCNYPVLIREFYLFPCMHVFHANCLKNEMLKHLDNVQRARVNEILQKIQHMNQTDGSRKKPQSSLGNALEDKESVNVSVSAIDKLKDELDDHIAAECIFCGDIMIKSISQPFVDAEDPSTASWAI